ncbi:ABC transporter ATP-binding protein [Actinocrinis puniceicyclus]|uniref:ABC transporter ATP-binding protein n=1 Tax=Actinocrinis puniceicyclus TaxID=977794 RepID=UPI003F68B720
MAAGGAPGRAPFRQGLRVLGVAIRGEPRVFAAAVTGSALYGIMTVGSAWAIGWATNHVVLPDLRRGSAPGRGLAVAGLLIVAVALAKVVGIFGRRLLAGVVVFRMQARIRRAISAAYLRLPLSWHQRHPTGQLLSNANSDVEMAFQPMNPLPMTLGVIVMLLMAVVDMFLTDTVLALVGALLFPAVIALNTVYTRYAGPRFARAQELRAHVAEVAHESFDGALVVKTLGREDFETERFAARTRALRDANIRAGRARSLFDPMLEAVPNLGVLAVLLLGATRVAQGASRPGDVVSIAYLITLLAFPIRAIGWVLGDLPRGVVGYGRVHAVLSAEHSSDYGHGKLSHDAGPATLDLDAVRFAYDSAPELPVLRGVSARIEPGRTVALVGATGSGKSTLATLLARLADPTGGAIRLDGTDLRELARGEVPRAVALVAQQTFLFGESVRANVALGEQRTEAEIRAALRIAQAERFVDALPDGLDSVIGERGTTLSGGQRQRLALARALVRNPRLLVLDDCTSAVDPSVEAAILSGLKQNALGATVVVVAYRKATVALADEVLYLDGGVIADRGTHEELLARSAGYRELITAYARAAEDAAAADDRAADSAVAEDPALGDSAAEDRAVGEPALEDPALGDSAAEDRAVGDRPATEDEAAAETAAACEDLAATEDLEGAVA